MIAEGVVREIVGTYELTERLEGRIISIATRRLNEIGISGFDNAYRYVDGLIEKFRVPFVNRLPVSLDQTVSFDDDMTLHEVTGTNDPALRILSGNAELDETESAGMRIDEALDLIKGRTDNLTVQLFDQLMRNSSLVKIDGRINMTSDEVQSSIPKILERLETLSEKYQRGGKLTIPKRPIIYIHLKPELYIRFGQRSYKGNPLAFYMANLDVYSGMGRKALSDFDGGLYRALGRHKQLHLAIPEVKELFNLPPTTLPQEEITRINDAYDPSNPNARLVGRQLGHGHKEILRYWQKGGKGTNTIKRFKPSEETAFKEAYYKHHGIANRATQDLHYSRQAITRHWKMYGLIPQGKPFGRS